MNKFLLGLLILTSSSLVLAEEAEWVETQQGSHIFINKNTIMADKNDANLKTITISVNIPSLKDRQANPAKTALTNPYPISYVSEFTINCKEKTAQLGKQTIHENFFGEGKLLEQAAANPNEQFAPLKGTDAERMLELACPSK